MKPALRDRVPFNWADLYGRLLRHWEDLGDSAIPGPPVPLILAGAAFSSAREIRARWAELLDWAEKHGFMEVLLVHYEPPEGKDYAEQAAGVSVDGRGWWPDTTYWNSEPRVRPTAEQVAVAFATLLSRWHKIAGEALAAHTRPVSFTGKKKRRLVVQVNGAYVPEWGSWDSCELAPVAFRRLRLAVNAAIAPLEVDHIDFKFVDSADSR